MKKFFAVIGNPPYQETVAKIDTKNGQKRVSSIFQNFQMEVDKISENAELIYPAKRWIHRSGKGMAQFGLANINDSHLSKLVVYPNAKDVFPNNADISDGISIVLKQKGHSGKTFKYVNVENNESYELEIDYPGESLLPINPRDLSIACKIEKLCKVNHLNRLSDSVLSQKLFGIESDFVERNPKKVRAYKEGVFFDRNTEIKLFTNDKAGKSGRATWFVVKKNVIENGLDYLNKWKVVVSSANAGGQKRSSQISILDNYSAFGRSRVALKTFKTKKEAENFKKYCCSNIIKFAFLLTDEALTSLAKMIPDFQDYSQNNNVLDFNKDIDEQMFLLLKLNESEKKYVVERAKEYKE
ncbi:MAG: Eco57I restriction-modification methylase domain-containing protein [Fibrobacteraceae bacterium]|mgnify:CR=1 FL=1|nr:Eco57I restriction-modification methylase domain-containing protein [Fibrobacteraceae bacterium]